MSEASATMNPHLMTLLEIQDLHGKIRELQGASDLEELEQEHFHIDPAKAVEELQDRISTLEDDLAPRVRSRYDRVKGSMDRVVVPVINGVCYGCFMSIATAVARDQDPNEQIQSCENCGRFIYILP